MTHPIVTNYGYVGYLSGRLAKSSRFGAGVHVSGQGFLWRGAGSDSCFRCLFCMYMWVHAGTCRYYTAQYCTSTPL